VLWDPFAGSGTILLEVTHGEHTRGDDFFATVCPVLTSAPLHRSAQALGESLHSHRPAQLPARKFAFELWRSHASSPYQSYVARLFSAVRLTSITHYTHDTPLTA
jgi:23S rRNA G2445 N2-methylase RlmL